MTTPEVPTEAQAAVRRRRARAQRIATTRLRHAHLEEFAGLLARQRDTTTVKAHTRWQRAIQDLKAAHYPEYRTAYHAACDTLGVPRRDNREGDR